MVGFGEAALMTGMSKSFLRVTVNDPNPERRLKTVRINRRRLNRTADLKRWFDKVATKDAGSTFERDFPGGEH